MVAIRLTYERSVHFGQIWFVVIGTMYYVPVVLRDLRDVAIVFNSWFDASFCHENRKECTFGNEMLFESGALHANSVNYARLKSILLINAWPIVEIGIPASTAAAAATATGPCCQRAKWMARDKNKICQDRNEKWLLRIIIIISRSHRCIIARLI